MTYKPFHKTSDELNPRIELRNWYEKQGIIFGAVHYDTFGEHQVEALIAIQPPYIYDDYTDHVFVKKQFEADRPYDFIYLNKKWKKE